MSEHTSNTTPVAPVAPTPEIINGVKIYPTSYMPVRSELHAPKKMLAELQEWHIEAVHIVIFFAITIILFISKWKRPGLR